MFRSRRPQAGCAGCGAEFATLEDALEHKCPPPSGAPLRPDCSCRQSKKTSNEVPALAFYKKTRCKDGAFVCQECGTAFPRRDSLLIHEIGHRNRKHSCRDCGRRFRHRGGLLVHLASEHAQTRQWSCATCRLTLATNREWRQHVRAHRESPAGGTAAPAPQQDREREATPPPATAPPLQRKPPATGKRVRAREAERSAKARVPARVIVFQCPLCARVLSNKSGLAHHMRIHAGKMPYSCEVCGKKFAQKAEFDYHHRFHPVERLHTCQFCGSRFDSEESKEQHERGHTGDMPHTCKQCGEGFRSSVQLRRHIASTHSKAKGAPCYVCSKMFRRPEALAVHMRTHTGERPYSCPECSRCFTEKGDMLIHYRTHVKEEFPKFRRKCQSCGQEFVRRAHYNQHVEQCAAADSQSPLATVELMTLKDDESLPTVTLAAADDFVVSELHVGQCAAADSQSQLAAVELVTLENGESLPKVALAAADDSVWSEFPEITIVSTDIQEYEEEIETLEQ